MILPSKELISEVLSKEVEEERFIDSNSLTYVNSGIYEDINIYELAHKCREWALSEGYIIEVGVHPTIKKDRSDRDYFYKITTDRGQRIISKFVEIIKTEPEAVFIACELVLEQIKCGS